MCTLIWGGEAVDLIEHENPEVAADIFQQWRDQLFWYIFFAEERWNRLWDSVMLHTITTQK